MDNFKKIVVFDTSLVSENKGDDIIMEACDYVLDELFPEAMILRLPTHNKLSREAYRIGQGADYELVCGTNLLSGTFSPLFRTWEIGMKDTKKFHNVCLMGAGWWKYQEKTSKYAQKLWKKLLSDRMIHSVRDSYTERKMKEMGFDNVVNTGCPTMWGLNPEFCKKIPQSKAKKVVTTLTCYHPDIEGDSAFLDILRKEYEEIYFWVQNTDDLSYLEKTGRKRYLHILPPTLKALDNILKEDDIEYCGTRLHAGIRALNMGKRSIIIANDNRAKEISKDTGLKIIDYEKIADRLSEEIYRTFKTEIRLPVENIQKWKEQFRGV